MSKFSYDDANAGKADFEWTYNRLDPKGLEGEGHYLAEFFLSRPKRDAEVQPLCIILPR